MITVIVSTSHGQSSSIDSMAVRSNGSSNSFTSIFYGQPGKAALFALIIPGGGQAYNKKYWKVPIALGIEYFAFNNLRGSISEFRMVSDCRRSYIEEDNSLSDRCIREDDTIISEQEVFGEWNDARGNKETAWIIMSGAHLFTIVEAFVDRHLINFDTNEDLSYHNMPTPEINSISSAAHTSIDLFTIRIPLNKSKVSR